MLRKLNVALIAALLATMLVSGVGVSAQEELSGELTVAFWGNVNEYETGESQNRPWLATYSLIKEWDEMHPNVTVTFISQPDEKRQEFARTQLINGTAADVVASYADVQVTDGMLDLLYDFTADLEKPNPYGESPTWREEFWVTTLRASGWSNGYIPEGQQYFLGISSPSNIGQVVIFYNVNAFEEAGVEKTPETFAELIQTCDALKGAGWGPFFADNTTDLFPHWFGSWSGEELREPIVEKILTAWGIERGFNVITDEMVYWAVHAGILRGDDPLTLEGIRLMKEMADHCFQEDWQAPEEGVDYFITKRVAMNWNGFWGLAPVTENPERDFEFGTFAFPLVTKESTEVATAKYPHRHGGLEGGEVGNSFMIPMTTVENGKLPLALDLIQFLTARQTAMKWCETQWPPCLEKGQDITEVVTDPTEQREVYGFYNPPMTADTAAVGLAYFPARDTYKRLAQLYMVGGISLEEVGQELQAEYERELEKALIDHPEWNVDSWPAAPAE